MKVVVYIGQHKVGSTALQQFLAQNWLPLAKSGILYPSVETRGFAHNLTMAIRGKAPPHSLADVNIREPHSALAYKMIETVSQLPPPPQFKELPSFKQMTHALRNQVRHFQPRALILCSEAFSNFGQVDPNLINKLRTIFPKARFVVYCALRRPDEYLISWHGQRLKVGEKLPALDAGGTEQYFETIHFNFQSIIEPWVEQIPEADFILRNYSDILQSGGSTVDFSAKTGVKWPNNLMPVKRMNKSLPLAAMEIVRRGNFTLTPIEAAALTKYFLQLDNKHIPVESSEIEMFGNRLRQKIAKRFSPIHDYLSNLTGGEAFFADIDDIRRPRPVSSLRAAADLVTKIDISTLPSRTLSDFVSALRTDISK